MQNQKDNDKKNNKTLRIVLIILCIFLSLVLVILLAGTVVMENLFGGINRVDPNDTYATLSPEELEDFLNQETDHFYSGPTMHEDDVTWETNDGVVQGENVINILLIGQDRRPGEIRARSDTMILCTINKAKKKIYLTSFMRDMYVQIPGYSDNRINVPYVLGGMKLLDACLEKNFGVQVDGNVEVDFSGFEKVIDTLGGVDIELNKSEVNYFKRSYGWEFKIGVNHLSGAQALGYARNRSVSNEESDDFGRTRRQRIVVSKIVEKAKKMSLGQLKDLISVFMPMLTTDLTDVQILRYLIEVFPILSDLEVEMSRIPIDGSFKMTQIKGMSVLVPSLEKNREYLEKIMADE